MPFVSWSKRPMRVDFPSSTEPTVTKRRISFRSWRWRYRATSSAVSSSVSTSEVPFTLFRFHRPVFVVVDHPPLALRLFGQEHFADDLGERRRPRSHRPG